MTGNVGTSITSKVKKKKGNNTTNMNENVFQMYPDTQVYVKRQMLSRVSNTTCS